MSMKQAMSEKQNWELFLEKLNSDRAKLISHQLYLAT